MLIYVASCKNEARYHSNLTFYNIFLIIVKKIYVQVSKTIIVLKFLPSSAFGKSGLRSSYHCLINSKFSVRKLSFHTNQGLLNKSGNCKKTERGQI